jgi:hypothetical protein
VLLAAVIISFYGGGFATVPAYLKDMFGTFQVGAIHGRLLTAWSAAGVAGPLIVNVITESQRDGGVDGAAAVPAVAARHGRPARRRLRRQPARATGVRALPRADRRRDDRSMATAGIGGPTSGTSSSAGTPTTDGRDPMSSQTSRKVDGARRPPATRPGTTAVGRARRAHRVAWDHRRRPAGVRHLRDREEGRRALHRLSAVVAQLAGCARRYARALPAADAPLGRRRSWSSARGSSLSACATTP